MQNTTTHNLRIKIPDISLNLWWLGRSPLPLKHIILTGGWGGVVIQRGSAFIWCLRIMIYGAFDLKFTSGNYDWDASNYEIGPFGRSLPLTTGNNRTMNNLGEIIRLQLFDDKCG